MRPAINVIALIMLGLVIQIGGAYLVNAAIAIMGDSVPASGEYIDYMARIRSFEPRQIGHVIFVAPLVEEIVFRLIFLRAGKMVLPFWAANLIQAALFGCYHGLMIQRVYGFVMGLLIGCVFWYCPIIYRRHHSKDEQRSSGLIDMPDCLIGVMISFVLHMIINAGGIFVAPLFPADLPVYVQTLAGCILMLAAAAACFVLFRQSNAGEDAKPDVIK